MKWDSIDTVRTLGGYHSAEKVPSSAFTAQEYSDRYGLCKDTAVSQVRKLVKKGLLATGWTRRYTGDRWQQMRVYWAVQETDNAKAAKPVLGRRLGRR